MIPTHRAPTHPGEMLLEEFLKPTELSQVEAAKRMHLSTNRLNEIVNGKRGVTAETALRFSAFTGMSAEFWLTLQALYDLWEAKQTPQPKIRPLALSA